MRPAGQPTVIAGVFNGSNGNGIAGGGFTVVRVSAGSYTVRLQGVREIIAATASPVGGTNTCAVTGVPSTDSFGVDNRICNTAAANDANISFIAWVLMR